MFLYFETMKKILLFILIFFPSIVFSQKSVAPLKVFFYYSPFYLPGTDSLYIEMYFSILGKTVNYVPVKIYDNNKEKTMFQAALKFKLLLKQGDTIVDFKKYVLNSPLKKDTIELPKSFADVKRFKLGFDKYSLHIEIYDTNSHKKPIKYSIPLDFTDFYTDSIFFSGIEYASSIEYASEKDKKMFLEIVKNDLLITPYVSDFFSQKMKNLSYYIEIYNTSKVFGQSPFLLKVYIENAKSLEVLPKFVYYFRMSSAEVIPLSNSINIEALPSGKYNLVFEVRDVKNVMRAKKRFMFGRSNPELDKKMLDTMPDVNIDTTFVAKIMADSLPLYIKYLYPISTQPEITYATNQLKAREINMMRNYFYLFWLRRNKENPEKAWLEYLKNVKYVNENFSTQIAEGYETDRGRVYLQYGTPDDIFSEEHDPGLYPYEIWYYYHIEGQNNVKFVFYNPSLSYNAYILIHSTARGEIYLSNWKTFLDKRTNLQYDPYDNSIGNYWGSHLDRDIMKEDIDRE